MIRHKSPDGERKDSNSVKLSEPGPNSKKGKNPVPINIKEVDSGIHNPTFPVHVKVIIVLCSSSNKSCGAKETYKVKALGNTQKCRKIDTLK